MPAPAHDGGSAAGAETTSRCIQEPLAMRPKVPRGGAGGTSRYGRGGGGTARVRSLARVTATDTTPRRASRTVRDVVISLLILVVALVVADRIAVVIAENRLRTAVEEGAGGENVEVGVNGYPFLTQLLGGTLDDVDLSAGRISLNGLVLEGVTGAGRDVATDGTSIGSLTATGLVPTATLQTILDRETEDGWLLGDFTVETTDGALTLNTTALTLLELGIGVTPVTNGDSLSFELREVTVAGATMTLSDIPFGVGDLITESLAGLELDLDMLPDGVTVNAVTIVADGAIVTLSGTDVSLQ